MNWILDNLQLVILVASAFAVWLTQRKQRQASEEADSPMSPDEPPTSYDEAERTRRIQEEIRRKIAERYGVPDGGSPVEEPPPLVVEPRWEEPVPVEVLVPPRKETAAWGTEDAAALERQRRLQEQLRELDDQRRSARQHAQNLGLPMAVPALLAPSAPRERAGLRATLRDREGLRQAMVLREVLGPPVALR